MDHLLNVTTGLSIVLPIVVLIPVRRAHIRVKYSVSWLIAASAMLVLSRARPVLDAVRRLIGLPDTPLTLFLLGGGVFLIMFFRFSVIVSHLRDDNIALAQRVAILEYHLQSLRNHEVPKTVVAPAEARSGAWPWVLGVAGAVVVVFWAYSPAMHGEFLFDDNELPFTLPDAAAPLRAWIGQIRPVLMFTYWINSRISAEDPYSYHVFNVILHCLTSLLMFPMVRRLLEWSGAQASLRNLLAGFAALLFLLHPVQAESVAYLAGRSEALSVLLVFASFTVFLYRPQPAASWPVVAAVLALFGAAVLAKEHTVVLPALLLLTDYWWNPGFSFPGIRRNWKLYLPMALGAAAGVAFFWHLILGADTGGSAGFGLKEFTWYQYFFTQCRALFVYIGMFVLPVNLTADWDFPISRTILDRGAIFGLLALLALAAAAWRYRRRFPLASYGYFVFLLLMSPTSSILPIKDPIAERRLYFSMFGLLLIVVDVLSRLKVGRRALAAGCLVVALAAAGATRARAAVWANPVSLWEDTVRKSPNKRRAHFQLAFAYFH